MSPSSLSSSSPFLGIRIAPPPRSAAAAASLSPPSSSALRSPGVRAAYAAAAERPRAAAVAVSIAAPSSLYDVLGVSPGASGQEIKAAYRRLARECHPDVVATGRKGASADEFMRVHSAYATLSDPGKRAYYDRKLTAARAYARSMSFPRYGRRTWETDQCW